MNSVLEQDLVESLDQGGADIRSASSHIPQSVCDSRLSFVKPSLNPFVIDYRFASQLDEII